MTKIAADLRKKKKTLRRARKKKSLSIQQQAQSSEPELPAGKRDRRKADQRREDLRNELWPESADEVWSRKTNDGWTTIPRVLPLLGVLLRQLTKNKGGDPTSVYFELWARAYDQGYVQITNPYDNMYASGYAGKRGLRTWQERMLLLEDHGFIQIKPNGGQPVGHVLLVNPLLVAARLRNRGDVPDEWWTAFRCRVDEIRAVIPIVQE